MSIRRQGDDYAFLMRIQNNVYAVKSLSVNGRRLAGHELTHVVQQTHAEIKLEARLIGNAERNAAAGKFMEVSGLKYEVDVVENKPGGKGVTLRNYQFYKGSTPFDLGGARMAVATAPAQWDAITLKRVHSSTVAV